MDNHQVLSHLEVDPAIIRAESIKCFAVARYLAKVPVLVIVVQFNEV